MEKENIVFQNQPTISGQINNLEGPTNANSYSPKAIPNAQLNQVQSVVNQGGSVTDKQAADYGKKGSKFKKIFSLLLSVFTILGLFVIVSAMFFPGSNSPLGGSVTLTYWGLFDDSNLMQSIISDFEKQNPTIKVKYEKQDINQYRERLTTRILNGTGPDIFKFHNTWYPMLKEELLPLPTNTISQAEFKAIFYPVAHKDLIRNGAIYGIPIEIDTLALFINTQLFQSAGLKPPTNWVDFVNAANVITVRDANDKIITSGASMGTYTNVAHAADIISMLFLQNGVNFNDISASSQQILDALTFYGSFVKNNKVWNETLDPSQLAFSKGNLGMYFGYPSDYTAIKKFNPNLDFQIVPVPQLPEQNVTLASYWADGASAKSKHQKEVLLFLKYLAKKETEQKLFDAKFKDNGFGMSYARVDLADSLDKNSPIYTFILQAPNASSSYFVGETYDNGINNELNKELESIVALFLQPGKRDFDVKTFINNSLKIFLKYSLSAGNPLK